MPPNLKKISVFTFIQTWLVYQTLKKNRRPKGVVFFISLDFRCSTLRILSTFIELVKIGAFNNWNTPHANWSQHYMRGEYCRNGRGWHLFFFLLTFQYTMASCDVTLHAAVKNSNVGDGVLPVLQGEAVWREILEKTRCTLFYWQYWNSWMCYINIGIRMWSHLAYCA